MQATKSGGAFNDAPRRGTASSTTHVRLVYRNFGEFEVPSLRNLAGTAPYMHNASLATLRDVVLHYSDLDEKRLHADGERILVPLQPGSNRIEDLLAFLHSLNEPADAHRSSMRGPLRYFHPQLVEFGFDRHVKFVRDDTPVKNISRENPQLELEAPVAETQQQRGRLRLRADALVAASDGQ